MKKIKGIIFTTLLFLLVAHVQGQEVRTISGKIRSTLQDPIAGAVISAPGSDGARSEADGSFTLKVGADTKQISVWAAGYYSVTEIIGKRSQIVFTLIPDHSYRYNEAAVLPYRIENSRPITTSAVNIAKKDFTLGVQSIGQELTGNVAGLRAIDASGMPGEGTYLNMRGIRSYIGTNAPLIVINGIPFIADTHESQIIKGFSRDPLQAYNIQDIQNITVLKGAEASLYGSLGSNGVILIETDGATSEDLDTKISYYGQFGMQWNDKRLPLLKGNEYKSYLADVGMTYYKVMQDFFNDFPFMTDPNNKYNYLYNNDTDWQKQIYRTAFTSDNLFRVEGGDAIAKYDLSLGYANENGILKGTHTNRYHTQLNTNVLVSKQVELFATLGLAYIDGSYMDQGMIPETNPMLAAYQKAPILSPYAKDLNAGVLNTYASYLYGRNTNMDFASSNPLAIVNTLDSRNRQFDINIRAGITYKPLIGLTLNGVFGMYYNYNNEHLFIPGVTDQAIVPIYDQYGAANNTVKVGVAETMNTFFSLNGQYLKMVGVNKWHFLAGWQAMMTDQEYDAGAGRNTANDFYQTMGNTQTIGRYFAGYLEKWNWMNTYAHADYTYNNQVNASVNLSLDGASSVGADAPYMHLYPSLSVTWLGKGWLPNTELINRLNVRAEYAMTGNSRFSSKYGKFAYISRPYQQISGILRNGIPNTKLTPERNSTFNLGLDAAFLHNRLNVNVDWYNSTASDVIFAIPQSSIYGAAPYYANVGKIANSGVEASVQVALIQTRSFEWIVGGNIAFNKSTVKSLGNQDEIITNLADDAQLITKVGSDPYQFYGYQANGVYATQAEADAAALTNKKGQLYQAGDVRFVNQNTDKQINDADRVVLGSVNPDYFGGFFTKLSFKGFTVSADFIYSQGNKAYNAVRRSTESLADFGNQSIAATNRWNLDGQVTNMPRAKWGDPIGNADFSSRWIEDASYIRMRDITLSYEFTKKFLDFFRSGTIYVTAQNLLTFTDYIGLDPEFSYSYADAMQGIDYSKVMQPKAIKLGFNLKF